MEIALVFGVIFTLFAGFLLVKKITKIRLCALCSAVAITWLGLLILYWLGQFDNITLIALLIGQSVLGVYYLAEKRLREELMVFRLPGWMTLTFIAYTAIAGLELWPLAVIAPAWLIAGFLYTYRASPKLKGTVDHIIACCRDW